MTPRKFIEIQTEKYGVLQLLNDLSIGEIRVLHDLTENEEVDSREFTVRVVHRLLHTPRLGIEEVRAWNDAQLQQTAITWAEQREGPAWQLVEGLDPYDAFEQGFRAYFRDLSREIGDRLKKVYTPVFEQITNSLRPFTEFQLSVINAAQMSLASALSPSRISLTDFVSKMHIEIKVGQLFSNLPDLFEIGRWIEDYARTADALDIGGFPFLTFADLAGFVGIDKVDARIRNAVVTNRLSRLTRNDEFRTDLERLFNSSSVLKRRWPIVEKALLAHQERNYTVSIPTLLAQVEGTFTDALILMSLVVRVNGKICERDSSGNPKLDKNGKPIQLRGLKGKVDLLKRRLNASDLEDEYLLEALASFFTSYLISERNDIMHGKSISYGKAKLSIQLVLIIYQLAAEFVDFEGGMG